MKKIILKLIGQNSSRKIALTKNLIENFFVDMKLFQKHSTVFQVNDVENKEAKIILDYHAIEKGLLYQKTKSKFGKKRIINLHKYLGDKEIIALRNSSQIKVAYQVMCEYYELHRSMGVDISDYFSDVKYQEYRKVLEGNYSSEFKGAIEYDREDFYRQNSEDFESFAWSRKSVRNFTGERVEHSLLKKAIKLASSAPSVCNRQASKVYLIEDKSHIDNILKIQGGFNGYTENVNQLLIVTTDRKYFYTIGERNQFYIDGGIFLMNLLYSLHYYRIANCPANWGKTLREENSLGNYVAIPESEKIICMIPIGMAEETFKVTLSQRRELSEILKIIPEKG